MSGGEAQARADFERDQEWEAFLAGQEPFGIHEIGVVEEFFNCPERRHPIVEELSYQPRTRVIREATSDE